MENLVEYFSTNTRLRTTGPGTGKGKKLVHIPQIPRKGRY